jgi:YHS domain-containing protein
VEEFSGRLWGKRIPSAKDEWGQSLGKRSRTERSLLGVDGYEEQIFRTGGIIIMTTDPVCGTRVNEKESEFHTQFAGRKYFFCSDNCRKEFESEPEAYVETAAA